jgi:hypothetical protein
MSKLFRGKFLYALEKMCNEIRGLEDGLVWRSTANTLYASENYPTFGAGIVVY